MFFLRGSIQPPERRKPASPFTGRSGHGLRPSPHTGLPCASRHLSVPHGFTIKGCSIPHRCLHNLTVEYPYKKGKGFNNSACSRQRQAAQRSCGAPSLEALKARLDGALGSLSWWGAALPMAVGWSLMTFNAPFNPNHSVIPQFYESLRFQKLIGAQKHW